ncbi:probable carbohydrate esterase At4g34215 [Argentina anserina]|uniref:probable carbohydrate esterase At4g34215 n=1 Tax=Argentina anserina TaxID=57926 RepID=UPI0021762244|nr:probable carbohydrate esterase At4g34215 [Potentilla anserina]
MNSQGQDDPTRNPSSSRFRASRLWKLCLDETKAAIERRARLNRMLCILMASYLINKDDDDNDDDDNDDEEEEEEDSQKQVLQSPPPLIFYVIPIYPPKNNTEKRNDTVVSKPSIGPHSPSPFKPEPSLIPETKPDTSFSHLNPKTPEMESPEQIFILSGQSNMAGRGGVLRDHTRHHYQHWDGVVPPESQPDPSILRLNAHLHWEAAREPLHADIDARKVCGVGPGMSFANAVRGRVGEGRIGLVPCAVGGTAIKEWARGEHLYENMVKRARESVKNGGEIKGLLWYQGESDTSSQHDVDVYHGNMVRLIENVRHDLALPSLPIVQVAICSGDGKYLEKIREVQLGMKVENVVCVDAKGSELKEDHLHLTTKAQIQLGQKLADAYLKHFGSAESDCHPAL